MRVGNTEAMEAAAHEALPLAEHGRDSHVQSLTLLGLATAHSGRSDDAVRFAREALEEVDSFPGSFSEYRRAWVRGDIADIFGQAGHFEEGRVL